MDDLAFRTLLEARGTLIIVDIQPAYHSHISLDLASLRRFVRKFSSIICLYNGEQSGLTSDTEDDVRDYLRLPKNAVVEWMDKGYAFFRDLMDYGMDPDRIVSIVQRMIELDIQDWRELPEDDPILFDLDLNKEGYCLYIPECVNLLRRYTSPPVTLIGGARDECLAEVDILLKVLGVEASHVDEFIY